MSGYKEEKAIEVKEIKAKIKKAANFRSYIVELPKNKQLTLGKEAEVLISKNEKKKKIRVIYEFDIN